MSEVDHLVVEHDAPLPTIKAFARQGTQILRAPTPDQGRHHSCTTQPSTMPPAACRHLWLPMATWRLLSVKLGASSLQAR